MKIRECLLACAVLAWPCGARGCAVCFGSADSSEVWRGLGWGLVLLLGATFLIMGTLTVAVWRIERRRRMLEASLAERS